MAKLSVAAKRREKIRAVEEAVVELMFIADQFSTTGASMYDERNRRLRLLEAGRKYGYAIRSLSYGV